MLGTLLSDLNKVYGHIPFILKHCDSFQQTVSVMETKQSRKLCCQRKHKRKEVKLHKIYYVQ